MTDSDGNPYREYVDTFARLLRGGRTLPLGPTSAALQLPPAPDAPVALLFSPHPDDEVLTGGLPLRLRREAGWRIVNVAVTQGSMLDRRASRWRELEDCCAQIGFDLQATAAGGLEKIDPQQRTRMPRHWAQSVEVIVAILRQYQPQAIFFPHEADGHSAHIGTHLLVVDALREMPNGCTCYTVETEFWGQLSGPNVMVELSATQAADLAAALACHVGEVLRNPYHVSLPARMIDNVRRGAELVCGQGNAAQDFTFAELYRLRRWHSGGFESVVGGVLSCDTSPATLFSRASEGGGKK